MEPVCRRLHLVQGIFLGIVVPTIAGVAYTEKVFVSLLVLGFRSVFVSEAVCIHMPQTHLGSALRLYEYETLAKDLSLWALACVSICTPLTPRGRGLKWGPVGLSSFCPGSSLFATQWQPQCGAQMNGQHTDRQPSSR